MLNENDLQILEEFRKLEEKEEKRRLKREAMDQLGKTVGVDNPLVPVDVQQQIGAIVVDEDKRWEMMFR